MNKIISIYEKTSIESVVKRDILIPVRIYKIPIIVDKNNDLNFLEQTILRLKMIDSSLEEKDITKLLGLDDKVDLVKFIFDKLKDKNLDVDTKENENKEVKIYWFYQELITGKLLPTVSKKIDEFYYIKEQKWSKIQNILNIEFEKNNNKRTVKSFKYKDFSQPNQENFIKTILLNNQSLINSDYLQKINYKNLSNFDISDSEMLYLHTKLVVPKNNRNVILITDGLDGDFSNILSKIIEDNFPDFIKDLKSRLKIDIEKDNQYINIPFSNKINNHIEVKNLIKNIENDYLKYEDSKGADEKLRYKKNILKNLFDAIEHAFEILSKSLANSKLIHQQQLIELVSNDNFDINDNMKIFGVSNKNNIQKFIAKTIFYKCEELHRLDKDIFIFLDKLLDIRNDLKHSQPIDMSSIDIQDYIKTSYKTISIILRVEQINTQNTSIQSNCSEDDRELYFNASNDIDNEFLEIKNKIDNEIKDKLEQIKFNVDEISFSQNSIKQVINEIYSVFEYIFKNAKNIDNQIVIKKYSDLPIELKTVKINKSLGAYYLNYIYIYGNRQELTSFIAKIIQLRGHGNQKKDDLLSFKKNELIKLKDEAFTYIKQIIKER